MKSSLFKEKNGELSTMRILTAFVVFTTVGTWCALSIMQGKFLEMPVDQIALVLGALGFKAWQRGRED